MASSRLELVIIFQFLLTWKLLKWKTLYWQESLGKVKSTRVTLIVLDLFLKELIVKQNNSANDAYNIFLDLLTKAYDQPFPEIEIKTKNLLSSWITKEIRNSSERKQKL